MHQSFCLLQGGQNHPGAVLGLFFPFLGFEQRAHLVATLNAIRACHHHQIAFPGLVLQQQLYIHHQSIRMSAARQSLSIVKDSRRMPWQPLAAADPTSAQLICSILRQVSAPQLHPVMNALVLLLYGRCRESGSQEGA